MRRSSGRSQIVLDASFAISVILPELAGVDAAPRLADWRRQGRRLIAPMLWLGECVSAIRRRVYNRAISLEEGQGALEDLFALRVEAIPMGPELCQSALAWAERLGQARAYDAFYLALAEQFRTDLWTADRRLGNAAQQLGLDWVRRTGEA